MKKSAYRNMRSFVVIDGAIAYEGRGAAMRLEGPAAERLERRFRADWLHGSGEDLGVRPVSTPPRQGGVDVQIVSDGPDLRESSPMMTCYSDIIGGARESLYMSFPYLMPNDELYASVKLAVLEEQALVPGLELPGRGVPSHAGRRKGLLRRQVAG